MATRSYICIELTDEEKRQFGTPHNLLGVYCHWDGYIDYGVGETLLNHYNSHFKAMRLIKHGDMSSLGDSIKECEFYNTLHSKATQESYAFFDENEIKPKNFSMIAFLYIYKRDKGWCCYHLGKTKQFKGYLSERKSLVRRMNKK